MKHWKQIAESAGVPEIDRVAPALDALEEVFRPLVKTIPHDVEPPMIFHAAAEEPAEEGQ